MTQVKSVMSQRARLARAIAGHEENLNPRKGGKPRIAELSTEQKRLARHMAWDGHSLGEIAKAVGWTHHMQIFSKRLRALNIYANQMKRADNKHAVTMKGC